MNFLNIDSEYYNILHNLYLINKNVGMKVGLERMQELCALLGDPQKKISAIVVAGTNGKGSVSTKMAKMLEEEGYKVGLYTSPHIATFRERIRINGKMIAKEEIIECVKKVLEAAACMSSAPSFFEIVTAACFLHFARKKVDFALLETGLGGRLDATNVVTPILSIITSISLDHTSILGHTREEITYEKAGIIKEGVPCVIGPCVPSEIIQEVCRQRKSALYLVEQAGFENFEEENKRVAKKAADVLAKEIKLASSSIEKGLLALPGCRFERVSKELLKRRFGEGDPQVVILDVGHNPDGILRFFERLKKENHNNLPVFVVYGGSKDKDLTSCLEVLVKESSHLALVSAFHPRSASVTELHELCEKIKQEKEVQNPILFSASSVEEGVEYALKKASLWPGIVCVIGSFFIMQKARAFLGFQDECDLIEMNEQGVQRSASYARS